MGYEPCPSYVVIVAHPEQYLALTDLLIAWALGIASGVLAALLSHWRPIRHYRFRQE